ncbi:uncharacterized protein LOC144617802 isoform X2 [Crassostrea virginica]
MAARVGTPYLKGKRGWGGGTDVPGSVAPGATHLRSPVTSHGGGCRPRRIFPTSTETRLTEVTTESYVNLRHMKASTPEWIEDLFDAGYIAFTVAANRLSVFMEDPLTSDSMEGD